MSRTVCLIMVSLTALTAIPAIAAPIDITASAINSRTIDGPPFVNESDTSLAFGSRSVLAVDGGSSSATAINYVDTGTGALFDFDMNHDRTGAQFSLAQSFGTVYFQALNDMTYSIGGQYGVDDATSAGTTSSLVWFKDVSNDILLFADGDQSNSTLDESFTVGTAGEGDLDSGFFGSATGNLIAGLHYQLFFNNFTRAVESADGGATATGCVTLALGGATGAGSCGSVPEPMPLTLLGAGLAVLGLRRKYLAKVA